MRHDETKPTSAITNANYSWWVYGRRVRMPLVVFDPGGYGRLASQGRRRLEPEERLRFGFGGFLGGFRLFARSSQAKVQLLEG